MAKVFSKDLGPCEVWYNGASLGETEGGVTFRYQQDSKPVNTDQKGVTPVDGITVGASICEVDVPLTRTSHGILATVVGGATYTGSKVRVGGQVGVSMYDSAAVLQLKPIIDNAASETSWLKLFKAYPQGTPEVVFNKDGQRVWKITFKGFEDAGTGFSWEAK
jgi:hypothetical protein